MRETLTLPAAAPGHERHRVDPQMSVEAWHHPADPEEVPV